jgi:hypothetical protein
MKGWISGGDTGKGVDAERRILTCRNHVKLFVRPKYLVQVRAPVFPRDKNLSRNTVHHAGMCHGSLRKLALVSYVNGLADGVRLHCVFRVRYFEDILFV